MLSDELLCLKRQLEKTKEAMRALATMKKRPNITLSQETDSEVYYLRESLCTKEMMIADLKHRLERLNRENCNLKCQLENKDGGRLHGVKSPSERDVPYLKGQIESLTESLELKNCLISDLQNRLACQDNDSLSRNLRDKLLAISDENERQKDEIMEQSEMLEDFRRQLKMLAENSQFKDDTIAELKCCLRKFTDTVAAVSTSQRSSLSGEMKNRSIQMLLDSVTKHLNEHHPDLLRMLGSDSDPFQVVEKFIFELTDLINQPSRHGNDVELFKEFLTNEINLKNQIGHFLTNNTTGVIESIEKLQNHLNSLLSSDMDEGFSNDLKEYLHQCYLSDDNLRLVVEYLVKSINNIPNRSVKELEMVAAEKLSSSRHDSVDNNAIKFKSAEEELRKMSSLYRKDKDRLERELEEINEDKLRLERSYKTLENTYKLLLDERSNLEGMQRKSVTLSSDQRNKIADLEMAIERLEAENQTLVSKMRQMERDLSLKKVELENVDKSMQKLSSRFVNLSSANDNVKDIEIERLTKETEKLQSQNSEMQRLINRLQNEVQEHAAEKKELLNSLSRVQEHKNREIIELENKLKDSSGMKSRQSETNHDLLVNIQKLKEDNQQLQEKIVTCVDDKSNLELKIRELNLLLSEQENTKSMMMRSSVNTLKMEMKSNGLESENRGLKDQIALLKTQLAELSMKCANQHVDKNSVETDLCKQKIADLESVVALLTDELNDKVRSIEEIRKMIKNQSLIELGVGEKSDNIDKLAINQQLISQKDSEIAYLKSKLDSIQSQKSLELTSAKPSSMKNDEVLKLKQTITELEVKLIDQSETVANLQRLLKEKDSIIENAGKMMKTKDDALTESERLMRLVSLQNTNIKEELSASYDGKNELSMMQSTNSNLREEIQFLKQENERLKAELKNVGKIDQTKKSLDLTPHSIVNKSTEELRNFGHIDLELKLKTDQIHKIMIENRRLNDKFETESQRAKNYEQNLVLKEKLLQKLLSEKEKIRATFITEVRDKNDELADKSKTVYFLNAELHRLSSELEILNGELQTVETSHAYNVKQTRTLEITQAKLASLEEENSSLKFCVNLKMSEIEAVKSELTVHQLGNRQLSDEVDVLRTEISNRDFRFSKKLEENTNIKRMLTSMDNDAQMTVDSLRKQLQEVKEDYGRMGEVKIKLEKAVLDLNEDNRSLKLVLEELENEKISYCDEIDNLRQQIDMLTDNLSESKECIAKMSQQVEREQQKGRRLSDVMEMNEQSQRIKSDELCCALEQLDNLANENCRLETEIDRLMNAVRNFDECERVNTEKMELGDRKVREMERKIKLLQEDNLCMTKEIDQYQDLEQQLDERIKRKTIDCEGLVKEHEELLQILDKYQQQVDAMEKMEQITQRSLNEESGQCQCLKRELETTRTQLCIMEEKWTNCNNNWLDKYGELRDKYGQLECEYLQQRLLYDTLKQDHAILESANANQRQELGCVNNKNQQLNDDCLRLEQHNADKSLIQHENELLQNYNRQLSTQLESLTSELVLSRNEIWNATSTINEHQCTINQLCSKLTSKLTTDRRYGSQPLLNQLEQLEQQEFDDLKSRYTTLCSQIEGLVCQMKKKDKRIMDLENAVENNSLNAMSYEQLKCDYRDLERQYQRLQAEHNTDELHEMIKNQDHKIDQLKSTQNLVCRDRLRQENDNLLSEIDEKNQIQEEFMDLNSRMVEVMNCKEHLEQQLVNYRQKLANQNQTIENLQAQLNNMEMCFKNQHDQCRGRDKSHCTDEKDNLICCLNEEVRSIREQLYAMKRKYSLKCERSTEELNDQIMTHEELEQEYNAQRLNVDQLSAQLFDSRDLIEQLTNENRQRQELLDESQTKINQLLKRLEKCDENIQEKDNEVRESKRSLVLLEKDLTTTEMEKRNLLSKISELDRGPVNELATCYDLISNLKKELTKLSDENDKIHSVMKKKDQDLMDCSEALMRSNEDVAKLKRGMDQLEDASRQLSRELSFLQNKTPLSKSIETQTVDNFNFGVISPKKNEKPDMSQVSEMSFASNRSTNLKGIEESEMNVLALQHAIEEYNSLVIDIGGAKSQTLSKKAQLKTEKPKSASSQHINSRQQNYVSDVIFVDVDQEAPGKVPSRQSVTPRDNQLDVMQLLRDFHIDEEYDETMESPEAYLGRLMDRYKELETFFLATLKIQFKQTLDDDTVALYENFKDNLENNRIMLQEHCQRLNDMLLANIDEVGERWAQSLTVDDVRDLIDLVRTQQMQMSAVSVGFQNVEQIQPFTGSKSAKASIRHLTLPYEMIWQEKDLCSPAIRDGTTTVSQRPIGSTSSKVPSTELRAVESNTKRSNDDSFVQKTASKETVRRPSVSERSKLQSIKVHSVITTTQEICDDSFSQRTPGKKNAVKKTQELKIKGTGQQQSLQTQASQSRARSTYEDVVEKAVTNDTFDRSSRATDRQKGRSVDKDESTNTLSDRDRIGLSQRTRSRSALQEPKSRVQRMSKDDSLRRLPSKEGIDSKRRRSTSEQAGQLHAAESTTPDVEVDSTLQRIQPTGMQSTVREPSKLQSVKSRGAESTVREPSKLQSVKSRGAESTVREPGKLQSVKSRDAESTVRETSKLQSVKSRGAESTVREPSKLQTVKSRGAESTVREPSKLQTVKSRGAESTVPETSKLQSVKSHGTESNAPNLYKNLVTTQPIKDIVGNKGKLSVSSKLKMADSRIDSVENDTVHISRNASRSGEPLQDELSVSMTHSMDSVQNIGSFDGRKLTSKSTTTKGIVIPYKNVTGSITRVSIADSTKINIGKESDLNDLQYSVDVGPNVRLEQQSQSSVVKQSSDYKNKGSVYSQHVSEGVSVREGKTKSIGKIEDSFSHAAITRLENAMTQLDNINFDNLDPNLTCEEKIRIYTAEIDYLNAKNLFQSYTINVLTDPTHFSYSCVFLDHINEALTTKAGEINRLQTEFDFDPHLSDTEKAVMARVLGNGFSYKQQFMAWIDMQRKVHNTMSGTNSQVADLKAQLQQCLSSKSKELVPNDRVFKALQAEKESSRVCGLQLNKLMAENEKLKKEIKDRNERAECATHAEYFKTHNQRGNQPSKIPLLQGSHADGPSVGSVKYNTYTQPSSRSKSLPSAVLKSSGKLVTPEEVNLAIASETSIDNLRRFAHLLAEDNFDLTTEIEKLLATVEDLRRQLKANCEILSETVEMLQTSENFVNDLEKRLSIETKKTDIISKRVDKWKELNAQVISVLQRILGENAPLANASMDMQQSCNYLLDCLSRIEQESRRLDNANQELEKQLGNIKLNNAFNILSPDSTGAIDFEFDTTLQPNGTMIGGMTFVNSEDVTKTLALSFDVRSAIEHSGATLRKIDSATTTNSRRG